MLQELADESKNLGLKMTRSKTKVMMENDTHMSTTLGSRKLKATTTWDRDTEPETKQRQGDTQKNHSRMLNTRRAARHL